MGCMDPTPDYDECVEIETARCDIRSDCVGNKKFDEAYPKFDGDTCVAYAKEHCRTRKIEGDYDPRQLERCVRSIRRDLTCSDLTPKGVDEIVEADLCACRFLTGRDAGNCVSEPDGDGGVEDAGEK